MISKEEIGAAYEKGFNAVYDQRVNNWEEAQLAGLVEVAHKQSECDAQIVEQVADRRAVGRYMDEAVATIRAQFNTVEPVKPWGNPRTPEEAQHGYYLVPASMNLRYAPQYADVSLNDRDDALLARAALERRGVKYSVYDRRGKKVRS